jgi:hypothetical protein
MTKTQLFVCPQRNTCSEYKNNYNYGHCVHSEPHEFHEDSCEVDYCACLEDNGIIESVLCVPFKEEGEK